MNSTGYDIRIDIQKLKKLPTLSYTAEKILNLTSRQLTHLDELVSIIERDPPIMSKVLGVANIVYLGMYKPITTVKDALLKIGFKALKNIALSISIFSLFKSSPEKEKSYKELFKHSIATGIVSQVISEKFLNEPSEDNFTAGVLHDIGLFALHYAFYEQFQKIEEAFRQVDSLKEAEEKIIGTTHSEIGKWIAEFWGLPEIVLEVILYHHDFPQKSLKYAKTVAIVQLSNFIAEQLGYYPFQVKKESEFYKERVYKILNLPEPEELILELKEIVKDVENL
ncbi:HDOD domain-containing protein [Thermodesulfovibrio sp. 3907-1M]|uniref:HDOD domain-containing protein n=1 Tax=Thermodesulfovibrio autotrophicus TaxID=3118333 RepID=A0AAU8GTV0_9BACT